MIHGYKFNSQKLLRRQARWREGRAQDRKATQKGGKTETTTLTKTARTDKARRGATMDSKKKPGSAKGTEARQDQDRGKDLAIRKKAAGADKILGNEMKDARLHSTGIDGDHNWGMQSAAGIKAAGKGRMSSSELRRRSGRNGKRWKLSYEEWSTGWDSWSLEKSKTDKSWQS